MTQKRNLLDEIQINGGDITFPQIEDEHALRFGQNLLSLRIYNAAIFMIENEIKKIKTAMFDFFQTAEEIDSRFGELIDGESELSIEEFCAKFPENFRLPTFDRIVGAYGEIKILMKRKQEFANKSKECLRAASDLDFGIAFGETWRTWFDRVLKESQTRGAKREGVKFPEGFVRLEPDDALQLGDRILDFDSDDWRGVLATEIGQPAKTVFLAARLDDAKVVSFPTAVDSRKERDKALMSIPVNHYLLHPDTTVTADDFIWLPRAQSFCSPESNQVGGNAGVFLAAVRRRTEPLDVPFGFQVKSSGTVEFENRILRYSGAGWECPFDNEVGDPVGFHFAVAEFVQSERPIKSEIHKAIDATPIGFRVLKDDETIRADDLVWNIKAQKYLYPSERESEKELVGDVAGNYVQVIRAGAAMQAKLSSVPDGYFLLSDGAYVEAGDLILDPIDALEWRQPTTDEIGQRSKYFAKLARPVKNDEDAGEMVKPIGDRVNALSSIPEGWSVRAMKDIVCLGDKIYFPTISRGSYVSAEDHQIGLPVDHFVAVIQPMTTIKPID
jgi:hypothetical protein